MEVVCLTSETKLIYINDYSIASQRLAVSKQVDKFLLWQAAKPSGQAATHTYQSRYKKFEL